MHDPDVTAPVVPPPERILSLPLEQAVCIVLSLVGGATWSRWEIPEGGRWTLYGAARTNLIELHDEGTPPYVVFWLRNPFTDPAAAWGLLVRERVSVEPVGQEPDGEWECGVYQRVHAEGTDPRRTLIRAVLHKYASDPRYSALIPPLLKMMEAQDGK